jgi:hypothetical protein
MAQFLKYSIAAYRVTCQHCLVFFKERGIGGGLVGLITWKFASSTQRLLAEITHGIISFSGEHHGIESNLETVNFLRRGTHLKPAQIGFQAVHSLAHFFLEA